MKLINTLNIEQKQAALSKNKNSLVVASAGTGKTSTIMGRIEYLLNRGASPHEIMLITFTSKAAGEIIERLERYFDYDTVSSIMAGTFHSIALRHITKQMNIKIIKSFEALAVFKNISSRVGLDRVAIDDKYSNKQLLQIFAKYDSTARDDLENFLIEQKSENDKREHDFSMYCNAYDEFRKLKRERLIFEFNDLLSYGIENTEMLGLRSYKHLIVDEFQDTNPLQEKLIYSIFPETLFCVGDFDQSIYGFNGADISIISEFISTHEDPGYFNLKRNYRSAPAILNLAEKVIKNNPRIYPKELIAEYKGETGNEKPQFFKFFHNANQFESIASFILTIPENKRDDVAILYRGNSSAVGAEMALKDMNIEYERIGGSSFFDRDDIQIMLACIEISYGEFSEESLLKAYYDKNVSHIQIEELYKEVKRSGFNNITSSNIHLTEQDKKSLCLDDFIKLRNQCKNLKKPVTLLKKVFSSDLFEQLIEEQAFKGSQSVNDDEQRLEKKKEILIEAAGKHKTVERFMKSLEKSKRQNNDDEIQKVKLMSVHASKGLEFNTVFIVDLVDGMFPNKRLMSSGGSLDEERRLFYVAVTRAKNNLWLCFPERDKKGNKNIPSPFLFEGGFNV